MGGGANFAENMGATTVLHQLLMNLIGEGGVLSGLLSTFLFSVRQELVSNSGKISLYSTCKIQFFFNIHSRQECGSVCMWSTCIQREDIRSICTACMRAA